MTTAFHTIFGIEKWIRFGLEISPFLKNKPTPASFCFFRSFQTQNLQKNCRRERDSNSDRGVEGEHADRLTTTTATKITVPTFNNWLCRRRFRRYSRCLRLGHAEKTLSTIRKNASKTFSIFAT